MGIIGFGLAMGMNAPNRQKEKQESEKTKVGIRMNHAENIWSQAYRFEHKILRKSKFSLDYDR